MFLFARAVAPKPEVMQLATLKQIHKTRHREFTGSEVLFGERSQTYTFARFDPDEYLAWSVELLIKGITAHGFASYEVDCNINVEGDSYEVAQHVIGDNPHYCTCGLLSYSAGPIRL